MRWVSCSLRVLFTLKRQNSGVTPTSKGTCPTCNRPVMGEAVAALGKVWHREHFVCTIDDKEIGSDPYFSWNDQIYCESHYNELFSPQCAKCEKPILENMISAMSKSFHAACFTCHACDRPFTDSFHEHEGKPFCQDCYSKEIAPKCVSCGLPILSIYTAALGGYWHPQCFICHEPGCGPFDKAKFFELSGKPYCEKHYLQRIGEFESVLETLYNQSQVPPVHNVDSQSTGAVSRQWASDSIHSYGVFLFQVSFFNVKTEYHPDWPALHLQLVSRAPDAGHFQRAFRTGLLSPLLPQNWLTRNRSKTTLSKNACTLTLSCNTSTNNSFAFDSHFLL